MSVGGSSEVVSGGLIASVGPPVDCLHFIRWDSRVLASWEAVGMIVPWGKLG
jgi:hypothetical protein